MKTQIENNEKKFYSVSLNNKWTKDAASISFYTDRGATVQPSRLNGDFDVFIEGRLVANLFESQNEQKKFLKSKGLI